MIYAPALAAVSAAAFRGLYHLAARLDRAHANAPPFLSRYVSCVHALALVALGLAPGRGPWWTAAARAVPLGYLAHDAHIIWAEPSLWEATAVIHHAVFAALVYLAPGQFPDHTARAFLAEMSVPFLNLGWMMMKTGADARWPRLFKANSAALLLAFLWFRVRTFTLFTFDAVALEAWAILPLMAALAALNWYWFALLVRKACSVALGRASS